jgi:hypothetical protein
MKRDRPKRVREQVVVYLEERDIALLEEMTEQTGLAKTELFRRGLRRLADETLGDARPGSSLRYLVASALDDEYPPDVAARADDYLYGAGYAGRPARANKSAAETSAAEKTAVKKTAAKKSTAKKSDAKKRARTR